MSTEQWLKLMSRIRFRGATEAPREDNTPDVRSPFVKDADRIIFSSAFRRLQDKTQVHPFPETDYVRTRLTHSLEVTSFGSIQQGQHARTITQAAAADRVVAVDLDDRHVFVLGALSTQADLILDRGLGL